MALFNFLKSQKYRLNLCDKHKKESSIEFPTLQAAAQQAREALANDILPTSIERYCFSDGGYVWYNAWYPNDISGVFSERKTEIAASLEGFIETEL